MKYYIVFILFMLIPSLNYSQCNHAKGRWDTTMNGMPQERFISSAVVYNDSVYIIGGILPNGEASEYVSSVDVYVPATETWVTGVTELPFPMGTPNVCLIGNKIFVFGGIHLTSGAPEIYDSVFIYDIRANTWQKGKSLPKELTAFGADTINGKIYAAGGGTDNWGIVDDLHVYDPVADEWTQKSSMNHSRRASRAKSWNGKLYVFGGYSGSSWTVLGSIEVYDPQTDEWTLLKEANEPRTVMDMILHKNKLIVFCGITGYTSTTYHYAENVSQYNLITDTWLDFEVLGDKVPGNRQFPLAIQVKNRINIMGGMYEGNAQNNVWSYGLKSLEQDMHLSDTAPVADNMEIDLSNYFSTTEGELNFDVCQLSGEDVIDVEILGSKLIVNKMTDKTGSSGLAVNAYNSADTISSNTFIVEYAPTNIKETTDSRIVVYPNPAQNVVGVSIAVSKRANAELEVCNVLGQQVDYKLFGDLDLGEHHFELDVESFECGIYYVIFRSGKTTLIERFVVSR